MKKILLSLSIILAMSLSANAQMWLNLKAGGGLALASGSDGTKGGMAILSGLGYKHQITKRLIAEGDVLFDIRSVEYLQSDDGYFAGGGTYIQVPLTIQYMIPFKKKELVPYRIGQPSSYWFVEGGPNFSYGTAVDIYIDQTVITNYEGSDDPISDSNQEANTIDVGFTAGLGINFSIREGKNRLIVGTRANYGLLDVYKDSRLGSATNLSMVGYLALDFSLTKRKHIRHRW
ncbi:MAG: hypothetical protein P8J92_06745 [Bacteroidia bacterium]|nr:hypothetical protein [Bacteroidia bacterium]